MKSTPYAELVTQAGHQKIRGNEGRYATISRLLRGPAGLGAIAMNPTPYSELVEQVGHQKIVDALSEAVLRDRISGEAARLLVTTKNWRGALIVLRWANARTD